MSSPERLNRVAFTVDSVFNKYSIDQVREALQRSGFRNGECDIVTENDLDMYYFKAGR
jgi:hypothetical protein